MYLCVQDPMVNAVIQEMQRFRKEFSDVVHNAELPSDLASFWLRKTKKPVLAVLLVQKPGKPYKLYRGEHKCSGVLWLCVRERVCFMAASLCGSSTVADSWLLCAIRALLLVLVVLCQ
jgi:hypothetical protein